MEILGPIGGFIVLGVAAFILVYKYALGPEIKAARASRDEQMRQTVAIAKGFEATSGNLRDTLATAERMQAQVIRVMHMDDPKPPTRERERG
ncbi:MAG: hypothetical protein K2X32_15470 [Phycisphaerales bacterium]|nr:hypothetical protein [Phycisphaerales bacterium]